MQTKYNTHEILNTPRPLLRMTRSTGSTTPLAPCPRCLSCGPHVVAPQQKRIICSFCGSAISWLLEYNEV
jgi:hypothetical protein